MRHAAADNAVGQQIREMTMQVTETTNEGLKREFKVVVPQADLDQRLTTRLEEMKGQIHLKGFRPGKAPLSFLKKTYGKALMPEIVEGVVNESSQKTLEERELKPALQPQIDFEGEVEDVVAGKADLAYTMKVEILPQIEAADVSSLTIKRKTADVTEADLDEALQRLAESQRSYEPRGDDDAAENGDRLTIDFVGKVDGVEFDGGKGEGVQLALGDNRFIPGFEEQLVGAKAKEERQLTVTFPEDYPEKTLAGKEATFDVTVQEVAKPVDTEINDAFATNLGLESLDALKDAMRDRLREDYARFSRMHMKRDLLDKLDEMHDFPLPEGMVEAEFNAIWQQLVQELAQEGKTPEEADKPEDELREEYRKIAERRVRLGLVLSEIGTKAEIQVAQDEINRAVMEQARSFPGQEQQVVQFYQQNPAALQQLRAPIFEDKVVDYISEKATVEDVPVSKDELMKDPDEDQPAA